MRKILTVFLSALLLLSLALSASAAPLKVAVVVAGGLGDKSFYDSSNAGLRKAIQELKVQGKVIECKYDPANYVPYLVTASKNFDLVFVVGFEFLDSLKQVAPQFPRTDYVHVDMAGKLAHVSYANFNENEGSFLAGALAALMAERKGDPRVRGKAVIGAVGGQDIPVIRNFFVGYEQGARAIDPKIRVLTGFVGSWDDPAKGKEMALAQHAKGADVVFQVAGGTGQGVIAAADENGFYAIGVDSPQEYLAPKAVLTSMVKRCDVAVYDLIRAKLEGKFLRGHVYTYGLKEGGVGLSWWTAETKRNIPADVAKKVQDLERRIVDGRIKVDAYKGD